MPSEARVEHLAEQDLRRACAELERRLRSGEPACAEDFLTADPDLFHDSEAALELVYAEFVIRTELDQTPNPAAWYERFPQWRDRLERLFEIHHQVCAGVDKSTVTVAPTSPPGEARKAALDAYELLDKIAQGGMGVVYRARQVGLDRIVALKMILAGADAAPAELARFRAEGEAAAHLQHPNIVQMYEVGERDGLPFFSLEFVEGGSLKQRLGGKPLPARAAAQLVETLARAMHYAHQRGIIHRDLKPANILLAADGSPKITDFGLAKRLEASTGQTQTGAVLGTPSYMAPEQAEGRTSAIGAVTDVYGLGATFYEILTGRPPFQGTSPLDTLEQVRSVEPVPPSRLQPKLPRDLETICLKCLRKEPHHRYASALELADDLQRYRGAMPIHARPAGPGERLWKWARRRPGVAALLVALLVLTVAVFSVVTLLWLQTAAALKDTEKARAAEANERNHAEVRLYDKQLLLARREWENDQFEAAKKILLECQLSRRDGEWRYLDRVLHSQLWKREDAYLLGAFDAAGHRLAVVGGRGVTVLDVASGKELFFRPGVFYGCAFHSEKNHLVTVGCWGYSFGTGPMPPLGMTVCDLQTGDMLGGGYLGDSKKPAVTVCSPRGDMVAVVDLPASPSPTMVWRVPLDGRVLHNFGRLPSFHRAKFSSDGKRLATLDGAETTVAIWDVPSRSVAQTLSLKALLRYERAPRVLFSLSAEGDLMAVGYDLGHTAAGFRSHVKVFDVASGEEMITFQAHADHMREVAFCPSGRRLATVSDDRTIVIWDAQTGKELLTFRVDSKQINLLVFSPDGRRLAAAAPEATTVTLWDTSPFGD